MNLRRRDDVPGPERKRAKAANEKLSLGTDDWFGHPDTMLHIYAWPWRQTGRQIVRRCPPRRSPDDRWIRTLQQHLQTVSARASWLLGSCQEVPRKGGRQRTEGSAYSRSACDALSQIDR